MYIMGRLHCIFDILFEGSVYLIFWLGLSLIF